MRIPPYFKQEQKTTCSLAALRMVMAQYGLHITESELVTEVEKEYGPHFTNIWNPTIARLACLHGITTTLCAEWPLLKEGVLEKAAISFNKDPENFSIKMYENPEDTDTLPEPLSLAYTELFRAVEAGCYTTYGGLTSQKIKDLLLKGYLIQTSIKRERLYEESTPAFHSILLYHCDGETVHFHDPDQGAELQYSVERIVHSAMDVGAFMYYAGVKI